MSMFAAAAATLGALRGVTVSSAASAAEVEVTATTVDNSGGLFEASLTTSHNHPSGSNRLLAFVGVAKATNGAFTSVSATFGGETVTLVDQTGSNAVGGADSRTEEHLFSLHDDDVAGGIPTGANNLVVSTTPNSRTTVRIYSLSNGVGLGTPAKDVISGSALTSIDLSVPSADGDLVLRGTHWRNSAATISYPGDQTGVDDQGVEGQDSRAGASWKRATGGPTSMPATVTASTDNVYAIVGVAVSNTASEVSGLTRPTATLATGADADPGSNVLYVATDGDDGTGDGSIGSPYATLEGAHGDASLGAGWTIVVRGGTYARGSTFQPTKSGSAGSPITVKAAEGETVILDYGDEFAGFRTPGQGLWEVENAGIDLWRSVATTFGAEAQVSGLWEEVDEFWYLYHYNNGGAGTDANNGSGTGVNYYGPGTWIGSDGRVHIRFQRPDPLHVTSDWPDYQPGCSGGNWVIPDTEDPNDYAIYLTRKNSKKAFTINGVSHWEIKDINVYGADEGIYVTGTVTGITVNRGLWKGLLRPIKKENTTTTDFLAKGLQAYKGRLNMFSWAMIKSVHGSTQVDDEGFIEIKSGGGGGTNFVIEDCVVYGYFDVSSGNNCDADLVYRYNWFEDCWDDIFQIPTSTNGVEFAHNFCLNTPIHDWSLLDGSSVGSFHVHHNVCWQRLPRLWDTNEGLGVHTSNPSHWSSGASGRTQPRQVYNNTIIVGSHASNRAGIAVGHCDTESDNTAGIAQEHYNNLFMIYADRNDWTAKSGATATDNITQGANLDGTSDELFDNNHYARVLAYSTALANMIGPYYDNAVRNGGPYTYTSVAALRNASENLINAETNGTDEETTNTGVAGMNAAAPLVDLEGFDFRPKAGSALLTGAKDLSATGWPGATADVWRGALDPDGDGTGVGPR